MSATRPEQLYETDFFAWTQAQAKELRRFARTRPNLPLDLGHLAEEIRDLGKSERDAVFSLAQQIIQHFLLIEHSPTRPTTVCTGRTRSMAFGIRSSASSRRRIRRA